MKIAVILASPTGRDSITKQYVRFVQQRFPDHEFELLDVGRGTRRLERDRGRFDDLVGKIAAADGLLWTFPVYTFLTPAALVRFIELLFERLPDGALAGKVSTVLTTSEHFYDHTAHQYLEEISEDLGMRVYKGFSANMEYMLDEEGRHNLESFVRRFLRCIQDELPLEVHYRPVSWSPATYKPELPEAVAASGTRKIVVITDHTEGDENLAQMIEVFRRQSTNPVDVLNLHEINMKGGCMGCLKCVYDGSCVYKDGFAEAFDSRIRAADVLVFAATIRHRYLSSTCKAYFDRNFRNGHRPILTGKPMGWLISGPLRQLPNLRQILEAKGEVQHSHRLGIVTDEYENAADITARITGLATEVDNWFEDEWIRPATFLGVGGRKVFRDLMWTMRGIVRADHAYYRKKGLYDFPQKDWRRTLFNWSMAALMAFPRSREWLLKKMGQLKLEPFYKILGPPEPKA